MPRFVHLHTHSHYSLLDGLPTIDALVNYTKALGMDAIALTDHGNLYGAIEFYKKAKAAGIKPILGVEAYVDLGTNAPTDRGEKYYHLILLAKNKTGWKNLLKLTTDAHLENFYYKPRVKKEWLRERHEGLIALSGCLGGEVQRHLHANNYEAAKKTAREYQDIFGKENYYLEIGHHPGIKDTIKPREGVIRISRETGIPLVATQDSHYLKPEDAHYHDILLAVQTGNQLTDPDRLTLKEDDFSIRPPATMAELFKEFPEAIENTAKIADQCALELELGKIQLPAYQTPSGESSVNYLRRLVKERTPARYPKLTPAIEDRINFELATIEKMGFADYFLIVEDLVNWAKDRGIAVGPGRGSAAGSILSYILRITDIDPLQYNLLFERFLNPERIQMPDIDIDIADRRRDEVFGYLREKYGEDRVSHIITYGTMAARASVRDVGRALGVPLAFADQLAKLIPFNADIATAMNLSEIKSLYETEEDARKILDAAQHLEGVARHASMHACGVVISREPLVEQLPLQRSPKDPRLIMAQFDMYSLEDLGILKMDLLGLKNLTMIEDTARLVEARRGEKIDTAAFPLDDKKTFELLARAETIGVFQLESAGMRRYLKELKPTELEDIIAMVALYRPGPMELIPEYVERKHGRKPVRYLHPKLEPIFKNTYGIMIYQEQLMRAARELAGLTLAEADVLRKAVGKKIRELLQKQKTKLIDGCLKNGIPLPIAEEFWALIEPFDRYGFNRSHAACYATIAYITAYLKAHYPAEFMTALLNSESADVERIAFVIAEARRRGLAVLPPDINQSNAEFVPEDAGIRFGLAAVKNVGAAVVGAIVEERQRGGPYESLGAFVSRVQHKDLNKKTLENLAKAGALESLRVERNAMLHNMDEVLRVASALRRNAGNNQAGLFSAAPLRPVIRLAAAPAASREDRLQWEKDLLGLYLTDHPLNGHGAKLNGRKTTPIRDALRSHEDGKDFKIAGMIAKIQRVTTKAGDPMLFAKIEDLSDAMEVLVFANTLKATTPVWREGNVVTIKGRLTTRNGETKLICNEIKEL